MDEKMKSNALDVIEGINQYFNDEELMEEQYKTNNDYLKKELEVLKQLINGTIPGAKFEVGEYVYDCKYGRKSVVEIGQSSYTENRGWVYGINYASIDEEKQQITGGGSSAWWDESDFEKVDNPLHKLIIKKHKLETQLRTISQQTTKLEKELDKIQYSLRVIGGKE